MNQLCIIWGYQEKLSSTAARPRADGKARIATSVRCRASDPKTASRSPCAPIGAVARLLSESEIKPRPRVALGVSTVGAKILDGRGEGNNAPSKMRLFWNAALEPLVCVPVCERQESLASDHLTPARRQVPAIRYPAPAAGLWPSYRFATIELHRRW